MGGRQAHGRPLLQKQAGRKKNNHAGRPKNGRVDVLALAAKQVGESKTKGIRRRDLDIERDPSKRRRGQDEEDAEEDAGGISKRRRRNDEDGDGDGEGEAADNSDDEMQSDSEGNEWHIGVGSDDDDSEIDSDEAFGESDDEMFDGYTFRGSSSAVPKKKKKAKRSKGGEDDFEGFDDDDDDDEEDVGDDGESLGEEAIDLAEALDQVSSDEEEEPKKKKHGKKADSEDDSSAEEGGSSDEDNSDSSDSDDMSGSSASSESESDSEEDDEDEDDLDVLKSIASAFAGESKDGETTSETTAALSKVSLADLGLTSSRDPQIKKSVKMLAKEENADTADKAAGKSKKLDVPLSRMQQDELLRVAAAEKSHETLDRWVDTVKQNRRAEHISFSVAGSLAGTGLDSMELRPITQKTAQTELEKTIMSIMEESGLGPSAVEQKKKEQKEEEGEEKKTLSPDELKQLVNQRRRERELQSREVARAKRIKKIKSKAYRRVHRREKARNEAALAELEEGEEVDSEEEREAQHRQRAMERMGSRHRESKWAKRAKNTSRAAWDDDFRSGLVDMARRDEELRRRVEGRGSGDEEGSEDDDEDEEEEDEEAFRARMLQKLQQTDPEADDEPRSALMNISFMKKAELARKKANDEAVAEIMRDLDGADSSDEEAEAGKDADDSNWTVVGRRTYGVAKAGQAGQTGQTKTKAKSNRPTTTEKDGELDETANAEEPTMTTSWGAASGLFHEDMAKTGAVQGAAGSWAKTRSKGKKKEVKTGESLQVDQALAQLAGKAEKKVEKKTEKVDKDVSETSSSGSSDEDEDRQDSGHGGRRSGRLQLHDTNLLIKALGDDDAAAEFAREKARLAAEEADAAEAEESHGRRGNGAGVDGEFLPGWGSWAGDGIRKKVPKPTLDKRDGRDKKKAARQDAKLERVIISERRVHKNGKYLASQLPHEFETKNQYERSLRLPVGPEWGTKMAFQEATKPRVLVKQGVVLPMARPTV